MTRSFLSQASLIGSGCTGCRCKRLSVSCRPPENGNSAPVEEIGVRPHGSAALVIVLIRKWLQPSGFTQNVQRTQRIVGGECVILQSLGVITIHSSHDNDRTDEVSGQGGRRT